MYVNLGNHQFSRVTGRGEPLLSTHRWILHTLLTMADVLMPEAQAESSTTASRAQMLSQTFETYRALLDADVRDTR